MDFSVQRHRIRTAAAVLRDNNRFLIPFIEEPRPPIERFRNHRPSVACPWIPYRAFHSLPASFSVTFHFISVVNILPVKIQGLMHQFQVIRFKVRQILFKQLQPVLRISAQHDRVAPPAYGPHIIRLVLHGKICFSSSLNNYRIGGWRISNLCVRYQASDSLHCFSVCHHHMMGHFQHAAAGHNIAGCMFSAHVSQPHEALRLIEGHKKFNPVPKCFCRHSRILCKPVHDLRILPASQTVQGKGQIPVEQRQTRFNIVFQKFIDQSIVEIYTAPVDLPSSLRKNPGPGNRETIRPDPHVCHHFYIFFVTVIMVTGHVPVVHGKYFAGCPAEIIPYRVTSAVLKSTALYLIRSGCCPP